MFDRHAPFIPPQFGVKLASEAWELASALALRRYVFCEEQRLFSQSDRDEFDASASTIVAVDYWMSMSHRVVGMKRRPACGTGRGSRSIRSSVPPTAWEADSCTAR